MLILCTEEGASVVSRYEHHGSHAGLHAHSDCHRSGQEIGPTSMDKLPRVPAAGARHRRAHAWTEDGFWEAARKFFRFRERKGSLL
jgi:hypothetical protein